MTAAILAALFDVDAVLSKHGVPAMSDVWRTETERFYLHPTATQWLACVGRGGAKTQTMVKTTIAEVLAGDFVIPPGERHYFAHVSENVTEAQKTLRLFREYLKLLRVPHTATGDVIELTQQPRGIRVMACRIGAVSGFRCLGWNADEQSKWKSAEDGSNPAVEVIASMNAMTVTHSHARRRLFSSPMGKTGHFYETMERGNCDYQIVTGPTPSWVANPSITEASTRALEPDERKWRREYAAEPQACALSAFDETAIARAFAERTLERISAPHLFVDPSSGRKDTWSWGIAGWTRDADGRDIFRFDKIGGIEGRFWEQVRGDEIVARISAVAKEAGAQMGHGDQREALMLQSAFEKHGITYVVHDWTSASKPVAVERLRRWLADGVLSLAEHDALRKELLNFEERITPSGAFTFGARGSGHDDYVALLLTAAMADIAGELSTGGGGIAQAADAGDAQRRSETSYRGAELMEHWGGSLRGF